MFTSADDDSRDHRLALALAPSPPRSSLTSCYRLVVLASSPPYPSLASWCRLVIYVPKSAHLADGFSLRLKARGVQTTFSPVTIE